MRTLRCTLVGADSLESRAAPGDGLGLSGEEAIQDPVARLVVGSARDHLGGQDQIDEPTDGGRARPSAAPTILKRTLWLSWLSAVLSGGAGLLGKCPRRLGSLVAPMAICHFPPRHGPGIVSVPHPARIEGRRELRRFRVGQHAANTVRGAALDREYRSNATITGEPASSSHRAPPEPTTG